MTQRPLYEHTQAGWPLRVASAAGALVMLVLAVAALPQSGHAPTWILLAGATLQVPVAWGFSSLTVRISSGALKVHFGFGWPRRTVPLEDITSANVTRTTFWEGWGVHRTRRGWLYNVSGRDAVIIQRRTGTALLIGSDEAPRLKAAIERASGRS